MREAFAELGVGPPEIVKTPGYLFAAYPKLQSRSAGLTRYPNGDIAWVCDLPYPEGVGVAATNSLYEGAAEGSPIGQKVMGHYAAVFEKHARTEIKLDRFGGYHLFTASTRASQ